MRKQYAKNCKILQQGIHSVLDGEANPFITNNLSNVGFGTVGALRRMGQFISGQ